MNPLLEIKNRVESELKEYAESMTVILSDVEDPDRLIEDEFDILIDGYQEVIEGLDRMIKASNDIKLYINE